MRESEVIERLRRIATHPAARSLCDDAAVLDGFVITHDSIAEGVHFLSTDPPSSVGWKLVATNLSDLAAKGAEPAGALLSMALSHDDSWDRAFLTGVEHACESYALPLIGGDTIALPEATARVFGMTVMGRAGTTVPDRAGARGGDVLWLVGTLGDAAVGLAQLQQDPRATGSLIDIYRRPVPQLRAGQLLAPHVHAMMDVSDGLLLDARRMAQASKCVLSLDLEALPLSRAFVAERGGDLRARLFAASGGDDYALLLALPHRFDPATLSLPEGTRITRVGEVIAGPADVALRMAGKPVDLPERLGFEHSGNKFGGISASPVGDRP